MSQLTPEDIRSIKYFITDKGDITRWCDWEAKKEQVRLQFPELIAALHAQITADRTLAAVVKSLPDQDD